MGLYIMQIPILVQEEIGSLYPSEDTSKGTHAGRDA
jgi:hypothetical protein